MRRAVLALFLRAALAGAVLAGAALAGGEEPVRRHVIALIEGAGPLPENEDVVHVLLELPLNHLGMVVLRHYVDNGPPPERWLDDAGAILTFFTSAGEPREWLWPWLERHAPGRRVVHFGEFGALRTNRLAPWLERFGLDYDPGFVRGPAGVQVGLRAGDACRFEMDPRGRAVHRGPRNRDARNRVWVETRALARPDDVRAAVVTGPWGGIALNPWTLRMDGAAVDRRWHLDPFLFISEALGLARVPAPHPSVLNGRRMWFLQVDGDGFESLSSVRPATLAAEVMLDEVFLRYRLPYTVSIIVRSLTKDYDVAEPTAAMKLARRILNLPHVEPASHGVLHTLRWQEDLDPRHPLRRLMWYPNLKGYTYNQVNEVAESIRFIDERLLEGDRRSALMLWTGAANPRADAIRASREAGAFNLNGGVFRWDRGHDSVSFVSPWSRRVGDELQVYAGAANENDFDGFFTTMPGAFLHVNETIERTGATRILKPADLYIHFYSAETPARLKTIHKLIRRWALEEPTAPVFASTYARAVDAAVRGARIARVDDGWVLRDFGACRTVRIDGEPRFVDWTRSRGLLGARRIGESLYVHLAEGDATLVFAATPVRRPHVVEANCLLSDARLEPRSVAVTATAHNPRIVVAAGFEPGGTVAVELDGVVATRTADEVGRVRVELLDPGTTRIVVRAGSQ